MDIIRRNHYSIKIGLLAGILIFFSACQGKTDDGQKIIRKAKVTSRVVSLRTNPVLLASEIQFLNRGDEVKIIGRSTKEVHISGMRDYWYRVQLDNDIEGWVFGPNLSIGKGKNIEESTEEANALIKEELERAIVGKWWEILTNGSTGYGRIYFWPDGVYKHGRGRGELVAQGKYTVDEKEKKIQLDKGSFMGTEISIKKIGSEYRLYGKNETRRIILRRAFLDPDAPEPGEEHLKEVDTDPNSEANQAGKAAASQVP